MMLFCQCGMAGMPCQLTEGCHWLGWHWQLSAAAETETDSSSSRVEPSRADSDWSLESESQANFGNL